MLNFSGSFQIAIEVFPVLPQFSVISLFKQLGIEMNRLTKLRLYKDILYCARRFPSIKRDKLVAGIRAEFRDNRNLTNPVDIQKKLAIAVDGLEKLSMYTNLPKGSSSWNIHLEKEPMPPQQ